ncbi:hypothetical protein [Nostoc sp. LPT]|nr:hypothetical protein [Nostoc sp. LPT]MBN4006354.1 hypothetical protein [Nostoc sp. LPT]
MRFFNCQQLTSSFQQQDKHKDHQEAIESIQNLEILFIRILQHSRQ